MSRTITGTTTTGIVLSSTANNPVTVTGKISVTSGNALSGLGGSAYSWTVQNYGSILATGNNGNGVYLGTFPSPISRGVVVNEATGHIYGNGYGVWIWGPGSVTNDAGGTIAGNSFKAIYVGKGVGTVVNAGVLLAGNIAVYENLGGTITNASTGTIIGLGGVWLQQVGTFVNAGTVIGTNAGFGSVVFNSTTGSSRLIVDPGAVFSGKIQSVAAATNVIELASSASVGTLAGFDGITITNFKTLQFDTGAKWTVKGSTLAAGLGSISISGFAANDTIDLTGFIAVSDTFAGNVETFTNAGSQHATLHIAGTFSSANMQFASDGGTGTDIFLGTATTPNLLYGQTIDETGILATSETVAAGVMTLRNAGSTIVGTIAVGTSLSSGEFILLSDGSGGTDAILDTVFGTYATGVTLATNPTTIASTGTVSATVASGVGVNGLTGTNWTVVNQGIISESGASSIGISLASAGTITNVAGGSIKGAQDGVSLAGGGLVTAQAGGTIGGIVGIAASGGAASLVNAGSISGNITSGAGISLSAGGSVTNVAGGTISGSYGVKAVSVVATVVNAGSIVDGTSLPTGAAVALERGGLVTNQTGGQIIAGLQAIYGGGAAITVVNAGTVGGGPATGNGIIIAAGGLVTNQSGGLITGKYGVHAVASAVTVVNYGSLGGALTVASGAGVLLSAGGAVTNRSGGTITGLRGIAEAGGTVVNAGSIGGNATTSSGAGVQLLSGAGLSNQSGGRITGFAGVYGESTTATLVNTGSIGGNTVSGSGVRLAAGGLVTNQFGGVITGFNGILTAGGATVVNAGSIGGITAVALGAGATNRLVVDPGAFFSGTVSGGNTIGAASISTLELASGEGAGTLTGLGTQFINFADATIDESAIWTFSAANSLVAGATLINSGVLTDTGTLLNSGTLTGNRIGLSGGALTNQASGVLTATYVYGVAEGGADTVLNQGTINASVILHDQGVVTNTASIVAAGTASGSYGVTIGGTGIVSNLGSTALIAGHVGVRLASGGTIVNAGTIASNQGTAGVAVNFGTGTNRLIVDPGAVFSGDIDGGNTATSVLELASAASAGTISGFNGTSITNFATLQFDAGAAWTVTGNTLASGLGTLGIAGFTLGDTIDLTGFAAIGETFASNALVLTNVSSGHATLHIQGSLTTSNFILGTDGSGGTDITFVNPGPDLLYGQTIDETGIVATSETVAGGTLTLLNGVSPVGTIAVGTSLSTGEFTLEPDGTGGTDVIVSTVFGTYTTGVTLLTNPTTIAPTALVSNTASNGTAIAGPTGTAWTVTNLGAVTEGIGGGSGVSLTSGGTVVNAGTIAVGNFVYAVFIGGAGSVTNQSTGTITASSGTDVRINGAGNVTNNGTLAAGYRAIYGNALLTVTNTGVILATNNNATAVLLSGGGFVTNASTGTISGSEYGIYTGSPVSTIDNSGTIKATTAAAIELRNGTAVNSGLIASGGGHAVYIRGAGSLINQSGGTIIASAGYAVRILGAGSVTNNGTMLAPTAIEAGNVPLTVTNTGLILSTGGAAAGVKLGEGGYVTNSSTGTIGGGGYGVYVVRAAGTIDNSGTILATVTDGIYIDTGTVVNSGLVASGGAAAVYFGGAGSVTNLSGGTMTAATGVVFHGASSDTLSNSGTIIGSGGTAVLFAAGTNRLIDNPGAVFVGDINGGNGASAVLELASGASAGTITGFDGASITNFATLRFDTGAAWTVAGNDLASGLGTLGITGFAAGDTIDLTGFAAVGKTFASNALVLTDDDSDVATLNIQGSFNSGDFQVASDGDGGTDITLQSVPPPVIAGTTAGQTTSDQVTLDPFSTVSITDPNASQTETLTITLSNPLNGALSVLDGGSFNSTTGVYSITGASTAVTTAIDALVFTPTPHQVAPGNPVTTSFTIRVTDTAGGTSSNNTTTVTATAANDPPVIAGATAGHTTTDEAAIAPLAAVSISDVDFGQTETATVTLSAAANGTLSSKNGGSYNGTTGIYTVTGTNTQVTTAIDGLIFTPTPHQVAPGATVTTGFTIATTDTAGGTSSNTTTTVVATAVADPPVIGGTQTTPAITDEQTATPFAAVSISDADFGQTETETVTVTLSSPANGTLANPGTGSYDAATGVYSVTGSGAQVTAAIDGLIFTPTAHQVAPGGSITTSFTVIATDTAGATTTNTASSITVSAVNDPPVIAGATGGQTTTDEQTATPLSSITISDADPGQTETVTVTLSAAANGALSNPGTGSYDSATGVYTVTGSDAQVTAALDGLVFTPTLHQVVPGNSVTTGFTIHAIDTAGATATNTATSIVTTAVDDPPTITNSVVDAGTPNEVANSPFGGLTIADPNLAPTDVVTVTLSDPTGGTLSNLGSGSYDAATGVFTVSGTPAEVTATVQALSFAAALPVSGSFVRTTTFTVTVTGPGGSASDSSISVTSTQQVLGLSTTPTDNDVISVSPDGTSFAAPVPDMVNQAAVSAPTEGASYTLPTGYQAEFLGGTVGAALTDTAGGNALLVGNSGNDTLTAAAANDTILGGSGSNTLSVSGANAVIVATGTSTVSATGPHNTVFGGSGALTAAVSGTADAIGLGTGISEVTLGGSGNSLYANAGSASIVATGTGDAIGLYTGNAMVSVGGSGNSLFAGSGSATIVSSGTGTAIGLSIGTAVLTVSGANSGVYGNSGAMSVDITGPRDTIFGGSGTINATLGGASDMVGAGTSVTDLFVTGSNATVFGNASGSQLAGDFEGSNAIIGLFTGAASLTLGGGNAQVFANAGAANIVATGAGSDTINLYTGASSITAGGTTSLLVSGNAAGSLAFIGGGGSSTILGAGGTTTMLGGAGGTIDYIGQIGAAASFTAGAGNETLNAAQSSAANLFVGGTSSDARISMIGGSGADTMFAGTGSDTMTGGAGANVFAFVAAATNGGQDYITDFSASDAVDLTGYAAAQSAAGLLVAASVGAGGVTITLSDQTRITFTDLSSVAALGGHISYVGGTG